MRVPDMADILALYDDYAPRLYALALRITGDETAAAAVLEEVFASQQVPDFFVDLVRIVREKSLARPNRSSAPRVVNEGGAPTPRRLVEEAFFEGKSVADLAKTFSLDESGVRIMLRRGLDELKS
jgi:DNA-directed RNA polymerase specialized sigma24 family protein